jgi:hypothetical protein
VRKKKQLLFFAQDSTIRGELRNTFSDWRNRVHGAHADTPQLRERCDGTQSWSKNLLERIQSYHHR